MKKYLTIYFAIMTIIAVLFTACESGNNNEENNTQECGECPQIMPPGPNFCPDGKIVAGEKDACGCSGAPRCEKIENEENNNQAELEKTYCKSSERNADVCTMEYRPVCGWFTENIKCFAYPCANTFSNPCQACRSKEVAYWTEGECPKTGDKP